jgi:hypothetical protein
LRARRRQLLVSGNAEALFQLSDGDDAHFGLKKQARKLEKVGVFSGLRTTAPGGEPLLAAFRRQPMA